MSKEIVIELRIPESEFEQWDGDDEDKVQSIVDGIRIWCIDTYVRSREIKGEMRNY